MCVIAVCNKRKMTEDEIKNCFDRNPDGTGIGWIEGDFNIYKKGFMNVDSFIEYYKTVNMFPHIVHFRIGTSGKNNDSLTHPFIVSAESPLLLEYKGRKSILFHNGIFSEWRKTLQILYSYGSKLCGDMNDTRILAAMLSYFNDYTILNKIYSKFIVLDKRVYDFGEFTEVNGIQFSNDSYKKYEFTYTYPAVYKYKYKNYNYYENDFYDDDFNDILVVENNIKPINNKTKVIEAKEEEYESNIEKWEREEKEYSDWINNQGFPND
jgi:predicted glutamine amidotransferase